MRHGARGEEQVRALYEGVGDRVCARVGAPRGVAEIGSRWWERNRKFAKNLGASGRACVLLRACTHCAPGIGGFGDARRVRAVDPSSAGTVILGAATLGTNALSKDRAKPSTDRLARVAGAAVC